MEKKKYFGKNREFPLAFFSFCRYSPSKYENYTPYAVCRMFYHTIRVPLSPRLRTVSTQIGAYRDRTCIRSGFQYRIPHFAAFRTRFRPEYAAGCFGAAKKKKWRVSIRFGKFRKYSTNRTASDGGGAAFHNA